ncbi:MAG: DegT/DnrJ/EryC1/StrS aminotransferase [Desulfobulbaceae bacterium BRH_c16a]|nr:MAG: DegT/DnrJ/EryC1/StrS aminotransferase [Desulfobulbaceae bacterium BRH_c16a]
MIPITRLSVGEAEAAAAADAVRSGWLSTGKRVQKFESMVAEYVGAKHAIATSSCTAALHLALIAAGVKPGDEVICPSYSFIATANAILYAGATPVFADIEPITYNISPAHIEKAITPRTTAILPVSQIGLAADIPAILSIARRHGLKVVEDAAPSLGAMIGKERLGSLSDFTCFSFDPRKILTTGEGGMITTNDDEAAARLISMRAHSASVSAIARHTSTGVILESYPELGYNYKLTDMQGGIGIVQMSRIAEIITERRRLADRYNTLLKDEEGIQLPYEPEGYFHVYQSYIIKLLKKTQLEVMASLAKQDIASRRILAIHLEPVYKDTNLENSLVESERASKEAILLPMFVGLTDLEQDEVVRALKIALD